MMRLGPLLDRKPQRLSGGEQQRVALARALVRRPRAFLMDEPLTNLDAELRADMRTEIKHLQAAAGHHDGLRHPRPGRGDVARAPDRHPQQGPRGADRHAAGGLQPPGEPVLRGLHRLPADEPDPGRGGRGRRCAVPADSSSRRRRACPATGRWSPGCDRRRWRSPRPGRTARSRPAWSRRRAWATRSSTWWTTAVSATSGCACHRPSASPPTPRWACGTPATPLRSTTSSTEALVA